jgi:hypothetical protein
MKNQHENWKTILIYMRSELSVAENVRIIIFWEETPLSSVDGHHRSRGTYYVCFQG